MDAGPAHGPPAEEVAVTSLPILIVLGAIVVVGARALGEAFEAGRLKPVRVPVPATPARPSRR